ncbi:hypothetical protein M409DRAFT_63772 [Zasmidium cellare ATCC 36951]|uniref:Cercosporin MFS transporter CTB4 n=1 Tax=Zasmidium cellare ATCC 36951 TaxID=1080233 RepID=A0A6A6CWH9_ZASCE|nr:uncharacterized protein M409DRAFT_63772 [Zasmidium cellare ATCC 36951]KAF2171547.1 hypothetical protein M409DRAFT_63772 [Zasmidium cellare ATCC 36951]
MPGYFQGTLFGFLVRSVPGLRLLPYDDELDEALRKEYVESSKEKQAERRQATAEDFEKNAAEDYVLIDWIENDPYHPRNWPLGTKCFVTGQICLLCFAIYIGAAIYSSGLDGITEHFHISQPVAILGLTLYVLGYGIGPMIWSPLAEMPLIGRSPIYLITLLTFVFLNFGVVYAKNTGMLLAFRFLTGWLGSPVLGTGGASLADMFRPQKRAYPITAFALANICGPTVGPIKWPIWELIWISGFTFVFLFFFLPETMAENILYKRTLRLRRSNVAPKLKCEAEIEAAELKITDILSTTFVRPFTLMIYEPIVLVLNLYLALIYAVLYCWLESLPIAFQEIRGFSSGITGLCFIGIAAGAFVVAPPYVYYNYYYVEPRFNSQGDLKPEIRLETALVGSFCLPVCLFFFGWTAQYASVVWIVPVIATSFFTVGGFLSFAGVFNYLGDAYPTSFASISAGNDFMRSCLGAAFPLFANQMFHTLGINWGNSLLGFLSIIFIPIIFYIWRHGEDLRMRSKNARHDI